PTVLTNSCHGTWFSPINKRQYGAPLTLTSREKNYMFFGNDHVGERGALLYGLTGNCRLNGIDPEAYLRHILSVLPKWLSNRVDELLPWKVVFTDK
ncbi:transposase domain-containing protein, partial [Escherichia coli]